MCFSASASFGASGILMTAGLFTMTEIKKSTQIMLASIPFLFSLQQLTEGMIWTVLNNAEQVSYENLLVKIYMFFALVVWPTWVPCSLLLLEQDPKQKKILKGLAILGSSLSLAMIYFITVHPVSAQIIDNHLKYSYQIPFAHTYLFGLIYIAVTVVPHFFSSIRKLQILGVFLLFTYFLSEIFYFQFIFSTWCYFAGIISVSIFFIVKSLSEEMLPTKLKLLKGSV